MLIGIANPYLTDGKSSDPVGGETAVEEMTMTMTERSGGCMYLAHTNETGEKQSLREHSIRVAERCSYFSADPMKQMAYLIGLLHDLGKYQSGFQRRIRGENIKIEHSVCGAQVLEDDSIVGGIINLMMQACIIGHHSGLPDYGTRADDENETSFHARLKRSYQDISAWKNELQVQFIDAASKLNPEKLVRFLMKDTDGNGQVQMERLIDKISFLTRYLYSCLVDADSLDTKEFCEMDAGELRLRADFAACLESLDQKLKSFIPVTELQKKRSGIQKQVFDSVTKKADIYFMDMPTGSGKTLAGMKFALEKIVLSRKDEKPLKRLIYVIPYNGIIDQTAMIFEDLFRDTAQILRHQSSYHYQTEDMKDEVAHDTKLFIGAKENWDAPIIITTAVQFFESLHKHKRKNLRKIHNIENSILVFDEVHTLPLKYMQPCLQSIAYLVKYLNCQALFLTATMPDFKSLFQKLTLSGLEMQELITDKSDFAGFRKCCYRFEDQVSDESLIQKAINNESTLIVVNSKKTARLLYDMLSGFKGRKYHLSTYMTTMDRQRTIAEIRLELHAIEEKRKRGRISEEDKLIVVSTSLIEAGVDLDFSSVFREISGLDSALQSGGRCNREGKLRNAEVLVFRRKDDHSRHDMDKKELLIQLFLSGADITSPESIKAYYDALYRHRNNLETMSMSAWMKRKHGKGSLTPPVLPDFKSYGEDFNLIESDKVSLIVPQDEVCEALVERLRYADHLNLSALERYSCSISLDELVDLSRQNAIDKEIESARGLFVLKNLDYYQREKGIRFDSYLTNHTFLIQ